MTGKPVLAPAATDGRSKGRQLGMFDQFLIDFYFKFCRKMFKLNPIYFVNYFKSSLLGIHNKAYYLITFICQIRSSSWSREDSTFKYDSNETKINLNVF